MSYDSDVVGMACAAYWPCGLLEQGLSDISGNGHNLTRDGGSKVVRFVDYAFPGIYPHCGTLSAYRASLAAVGTTINAPFSVVAWARFGSIGLMKIVGTRHPSDFGFSMGITTGGLFSFDVGTGLAWLLNYSSPWAGIHTGDWAMWAVTISAAGWHFYVNGTEFDTGNPNLSTAILWNPTHLPTLFARDAADTEPMTGDLSRVSFHSTALTAVQVAQLWLDGLPQPFFGNAQGAGVDIGSSIANILASVRKVY